MNGQPSKLRCFPRKIFCMGVMKLMSFWDDAHWKEQLPAWHYAGWTCSHVGRVVYISKGLRSAAGVICDLQPPLSHPLRSMQAALCRVSSGEQWLVFPAAWVLWSLLVLLHNEISCQTDVLVWRKTSLPWGWMGHTGGREEPRGHLKALLQIISWFLFCSWLRYLKDAYWSEWASPAYEKVEKSSSSRREFGYTKHRWILWSSQAVHTHFQDQHFRAAVCHRI